MFDYSEEMSESMSPKSDSELMVKPADNILRAESHMQWTWGEFPESTRVRLTSKLVRISECLGLEVCLFMFVFALLFSGLQVNKKESKSLTITPSENTHFRVILSTDVMEEEPRQRERTPDPICSIIKPEPRTIVLDQHSHKPQPREASPDNTNFTNKEPEHSNLTSEPANSDVSTKTARKTRWTSSPPSRKDSGSAPSGGSAKAALLPTVCPDSRSASKPSESPSTRRSNKSSFVTLKMLTNTPPWRPTHIGVKSLQQCLTVDTAVIVICIVKLNVSG